MYSYIIFCGVETIFTETEAQLDFADVNTGTPISTLKKKTRPPLHGALKCSLDQVSDKCSAVLFYLSTAELQGGVL